MGRIILIAVTKSSRESLFEIKARVERVDARQQRPRAVPTTFTALQIQFILQIARIDRAVTTTVITRAFL